MDTSFDVDVHPSYLHIKHPPGFVISAENTEIIWGRIKEVCRENGVTKVLVEAQSPTRQLDTMSAFDSGRILAETLSGLTIAMCFHDYQFDELTSFFKTVAQNRGVKIEYFSDLRAALEWLDVDTGEKAAGSK